MSLFRSEQEALRFAFTAADRSILKLSSAFTSNRGSTVRAPSELTPLDWIAQAGMIVGRVRAELSGDDLLIVEARFTSPSTAEGVTKKIEVLPVFVPRILAERRKKLDMWFVADVLRGWTGARRHHNDDWWARHMEKSPETIRRWRMSEEERNMGVEKRMDILLYHAVIKLNAPFIDAGWIPGD